MTKEECFTDAFRKIRLSILEAKMQERNRDDKSNYDGGILLCDKLLERIQVSSISFPCDELLAPFRYYMMDSLPWTGDILETIENEMNELEKYGVIRKQ